MEYILKQNSWFGGKEVLIDLPDDWGIRFIDMPADHLDPLTKDDIKKRIDKPFGSDVIVEIAKNKKDVAIVFDDMSRGTPCKDIAEIIIDELHIAGIKDHQIRFICANGSHGSCDRIDFEKKLGAEIVKRFAVFNHNPFQNCEYVGKTSGGVELYINGELMKCDLKIGIGSISPHPVNGFGGGGKLLMIGTAGINTIDQLHKKAANCIKEKKLCFISKVGSLKLDGMRKQIEEGVKMIGFDFKIDAILNSDCKIVELTAGDPIEEYYKGADLSSKLNCAGKMPENMDIVIANANVKANEASIALSTAYQLLKKDGSGALVLVDHTKMGQVYHQYSGAAGYYIGGKAHKGNKDRFPKAHKVIFYTPYPDLASIISFKNSREIIVSETWEDVLEQLDRYGKNSKVAVLSDATIMSFEEE